MKNAGKLSATIALLSTIVFVTQMASAVDVLDMGPGLTSLEMVTIGNEGNAADTHGDGYGAVDYVYDIGKFEVTSGQYVEFLNAIGVTDTYEVYHDYMWSGYEACGIERIGSAGSYSYSVAADLANRPVSHVSWGSAARFTNWLHNGQPTGLQNAGTTEAGSYNLSGAMTAAELSLVTRQANASWMIPTEDEWYKAAYYDGGGDVYYDYATGTNSSPSSVLIDPDSGNNANYYDGDYMLGNPLYRTEVGEFENSASPYGTFDQSGNVAEWNETLYGTTDRGLRGGAYGYTVTGGVGDLAAGKRSDRDPTYSAAYVKRIGFRVGNVVPEPVTLSLLAMGGLAVLRRRKK